MECNKEEAIKAKKLAETKMQSGDFFGAQTYLLKAQQLYPDLDNLPQLSTVCHVHCSAKNKIHGSLMDWYGILQVEQMADEANIKKQYRKLALLLHPDKNKFFGAEAAFKLIGEANGVLSDHAKRALYDKNAKFSVKTAAQKAPTHQVNKNSDVRRPFRPSNASNAQFKTSNVHSKTPENLHGQETFWTCCPFCYVRYQYYKEILNRVLQCLNCSKFFPAYELGAQGMSQNNNVSQPANHHQKQYTTKGPFRASSLSASQKRPSSAGVQDTLNSSKTARSEPASTTESACCRHTERKDEFASMMGETEKEFVATRANTEKEGRNSADVSRKGKNASHVKCRVSSGTSCNDKSENVVLQDNGNEQKSGNRSGNCRRSARNKRHVSYAENLSDDDFVSPPKVSKVGESCRENQEEIKMDFCSGFQNISSSDGSTIAAKPKPEIDSAFAAEPESIECPDPEFSDFDKNKLVNCFAAGQIWAIYDELDSMPRYYARIIKVTRARKLQIAWLEPDPDDFDQINWVNEELPVACGIFSTNGSKATVAISMLSHQVEFKMRYTDNSCVIYPRKGETWAIFKDWNMGWCSELERHRHYEFEIVEVLSDFVQGSGLLSVHLEKVNGFVSLYQQKKRRVCDIHYSTKRAIPIFTLYPVI